MKTKIIKINPNKPEISKIKTAAKILKQGGLVAFPTDTVYGLGADAFNVHAVKKIFQVKKRLTNKPLIILIANKKTVYKLAKNVSINAKKLINKFWPGPLTIVFKKSQIVPEIITGNLDTVGIRMPDNKIALNLIKEAKTPIVATSANISGKLSPTCS
ncbi:threonylcarbamoyl-AMP synthase, partial [Patescibacteria group bacterium]|nr:threonylcarbamoyl-AMP synthase [Patescibacteria group bacterium]